MQIFSCRQKKKWVESVLLRQENVLLKHCLILAVRCAGKCRKCRMQTNCPWMQENIFMPIIRQKSGSGDRCHAIGCNSSYISRIMKQELGISLKIFSQGFVHVRQCGLWKIGNCRLIRLQKRKVLSNQHYFSAAFKNCQGMSPQNSP